MEILKLFIEWSHRGANEANTLELDGADGNADGRQVEDAEDNLPASFYCPITQDIMRDPVTTVDGQTYERSAIEEWFKNGNVTSPLTMKKLPHLILITAYALRAAIEELAPSSDSDIVPHHHCNEAVLAATCATAEALGSSDAMTYFESSHPVVGEYARSRDWRGYLSHVNVYCDVPLTPDDLEWHSRSNDLRRPFDRRFDLAVSGISAEVTEAMIYEIFSAVGPVASVKVARDPLTKQSRMIAGINFVQPSDVAAAARVQACDPTTGRLITVVNGNAGRHFCTNDSYKCPHHRCPFEGCNNHKSVNDTSCNAHAAAAAALLAHGLEPLTASALDSATTILEQKQMLGERLYVLIQQTQHAEQAGKITGVLLEMHNSELLNLLADGNALNAKTREAVEVLEARSRSAGQPHP